MDDADLDRIETALADDNCEASSTELARLLLRHADDLVALARRGLRAERETCRTCKHGEEYRPDRVDCLYHSAIYHAAHFCSRWEAKP